LPEQIKRLAEPHKKRLKDKQRNEATSNQNREILSTKAPKRREEVRNVIKAKRDAFNAEIKEEALSWDILRSDSLSITRKDDSSKLEGKYDHQTHMIAFSVSRQGVRKNPLVRMDFVATVKGYDVCFVPREIIGGPTTGIETAAVPPEKGKRACEAFVAILRSEPK